MHDFPDHFDTKQFTGKILQQICFAAYSYYLHFDEGLLITVEGPSFHSHADGKQDHITFPLVDSKLLGLIGASITNTGIEGSIFSLSFSNSETLLLEGDNGPYESFHIRTGQFEITI